MGAMISQVRRHTSICRSPRVQQVEGIFDVSPSSESEQVWRIELPLESRKWNIGLICGPSGCGKTSIADALFGEQVVRGFEWAPGKSILDDFPADMGIKEITHMLGSVGFSSPPSWLRPFAALSNGEQFRVTMARVLAEKKELAVVDEFTSVVDRVVAQIGSSAVAKTVRRTDRKFIAVSCHMDIEEWLQPDWVFLPHENRFLWRSVQHRPDIQIVVNRASHREWEIFKRHHYLTASIHKAAMCFVGFWRGRPVAFDSWLPFVGRLRGTKRAYRGHRRVVLPDYQGVGIGRHMCDRGAAVLSGLGHRVFSGTSHPAEIANRVRSKGWVTTCAPSIRPRGTHHVDRTRSVNRLRASFEWVGEPMPLELAERALLQRCESTA